MRSLILLLLVGVLSCTDEPGTRKALLRKGYTNIQIVGPGSPLDCWDDDDMVTKFIAERDNVKYTGVTCCDLFLCTIHNIKKVL
jgi:hypothetical protein